MFKFSFCCDVVHISLCLFLALFFIPSNSLSLYDCMVPLLRGCFTHSPNDGNIATISSLLRDRRVIAITLIMCVSLCVCVCVC